MSKNVEIGIFLVSQTSVNKEEVRKWLDFLGADKWEFPDEEAVADPALDVALAAKRCYMAFEPGLNPNVSRVRADYVAYFDNILRSGHGSVLEHATFGFAFENVSRVFTAEMNRHRAGMAISEGSLRFIRFSEYVPWWCPLTLRPECDFPVETPFDDEKLADIKSQTVDVFNEAFFEQASLYRKLCELWEIDIPHDDNKFPYKKVVTSMFRRIIGMGVATGGRWTGNVRALRHIFAMRASEHAEEEICYVFSHVARMMAEAQPLLFGDFHQNENGFWVPKYSKV